MQPSNYSLSHSPRPYSTDPHILKPPVPEKKPLYFVLIVHTLSSITPILDL